MRTDGRESDNVEDRRGQGGAARPAVSASSWRARRRHDRGGAGASYFLGIDPRLVMGVLGGLESGAPTQVQAPAQPAGKPTDDIGRFVGGCSPTRDTWRAIFRQAGGSYQEPKVVAGPGRYPTACGMCSRRRPILLSSDQKVYLDLSFFRQLQERSARPATSRSLTDRARWSPPRAEPSSHQEQTAKLRSRMSSASTTMVSVRVELQADCFAGVWAHTRSASGRSSSRATSTRRCGQRAPSATTCCRSARKATWCRLVHPRSAAQRTRWFRNGFETGSMQACNTFERAQL